MSLKDSGVSKSKFLSAEPSAIPGYPQKQNVVTISLDKAHIIPLSNNKLFNQVSLDAYMNSGKSKKNLGTDKSRFRYEFKQNKFEHKSFVQGQKCHIHKSQPSK
jgi:hypothetical protein